MTGRAAAARPSGSQGWQLILADLALILFLLTLSALPAAEAEAGRRPNGPAARGEELATAGERAEIAAAQALYRPLAGGPGIAEWLALQSPDPRATLTVFARYRPGREAEAWRAARELAAAARSSGVPVRTIIAAGSEADLYASLAYDAGVPAGAGMP